MGGIGANNNGASGGITGVAQTKQGLSNDATMEEVVAYFKDNLHMDKSNKAVSLSRFTMIETSRSIDNLLNELSEEQINDLFGDKDVKVRYSNYFSTKNGYYAIAAYETGTDSILVNKKYFGKGQHDSFAKVIANQTSNPDHHFHPLNSTHADILSHELGHLMEMHICTKHSPYANYAWNTQEFAKAIVEDAWKEVKSQFKRPDGTKMSKTEAMNTISGYAAKKGKRHETIAEAVSDYAASGKNANPFSVAIWKRVKDLL